MSSWTHNICWRCWLDQEPVGKEPTTLVERDRQRCCWCGVDNYAGMFQRADPDETPCKGKHGDALADS